MAEFGNRVKETTDTTGTGTLDLNGNATGFKAFSDEFTSGDADVSYLIVDDPDNPTEYEYGKGTFTTGSPNTLSRDTVEGSSNGGSKVSFSAGTKTVIASPTARDLHAITDTIDGSLTTAGTSTAYTVTSNRGIAAYYDGLMLAVDWHVASGASPTIAVDGLLAKALVWPDGTAVTTNDLPANSKSLIQYDGTSFQVITVPGAPSTGGISNVVEDTTPQLGGDLDLNGNQITSPDGTDLIDIPNGSIDLQTNSVSRLDASDTGIRMGGANARVTTILDEDNMASDSATALATQQSIKAYVDSLLGSQTKEFFVRFSGNDNDGDHGGVTINGGATANAYLTFLVPADFSSITAAEVIILPGVNNAALDLDVDVDYGAVGEASTTHTGSDTTSTYNVTNGTLFAISISSLLGSLAAGDYVGVHLTLGPSENHLALGVRFKYA